MAVDAEQFDGGAMSPAVASAIEDRAAGLGDRGELLRRFSRTVLRRLSVPDTQAAPEAVADVIVEVFDLIADAPGPTTRVVQRTGDLLDRDRPTTVVELHGLDRPFLLSTVRAALREMGLAGRRTLHPVIGVRRDADGRLTELVGARDAEARESIIHIELDRVLDDAAVAELTRSLEAATADLRAATDDWAPMRRVLAELSRGLRSGSLAPRAGEALRTEVAELLDWLDDGNLVLLGVRGYDVADGSLTSRPGSGLGILRDDRREHPAAPFHLDDLPEAQLDRLLAPQVLRVTRAHERSLVQRRAPYDVLVVLERDAAHRVVGLTRVLGLFTRGAMAQPARTTPVLRTRLARLLEREDVVSGSHDEAALIEVFESIPRDELFATDQQELHDLVIKLVAARERDEVRAVVRLDPATHVVHVVATIPRYRYSPEVRQAFTEHLRLRLADPDDEHEIGVDVDVSLAADHEVLVRFAVQLAYGTEPRGIPSGASLGEELRRLTRTWADGAVEALRAAVGPAEAERLRRDVLPRLPAGYRAATRMDDVVADVLAIDSATHELDLRIVPPVDGRGRVRAIVRGEPLVLSDVLPLLEALGLRVMVEQPHRLVDVDGLPTQHLHDFGVDGLPEDLDEADAQRVADTLRAAWRGETSSDSLHRLVLGADLTWQEVALLRAYRRYRRQVGTSYTPEYVNDALAANPEVVRAIVAHAHARLDPGRAVPDDQLATTRDAALLACDAVERLDHDRILRDLVALVDATLRTNLHRHDGAPVVALKFDPSAVPGIPAPVPYREIFVYGPSVEGIHLRGGEIARGGLRWSDRQDDVRTEVLGLMKAQMLKNAVIVPTGAKGGFVLRHPPAERDALRAEVEAQYRVFVQALLSITDDLDGDTVVPPEGVVRRDGDDPYLVVAADKGTATFSDVANGIAEQAGYWLGDAFASGGSKGYDHKALGVTARGAWIAVRRHLLELGIDPEREPVSVVGIGDMSGDVFGNGLLSSRTLRLVAAFDHRDVFIDPDPDPAASFLERQRLFELPRSSWRDYDESLLSPGGMIVSRAAKSVELNDEIRTLLRIEDERLSPAALIRAALAAPVDLLWAGGIGTYVKAGDETHADVGDRANDELRIDAEDLRARVVGEGANLGVTQRARIKYARRGGRIDQDAIHNVGGVDTSDHEVNVKILLAGAIRDGVLSPAERDDLLVEVTDEVVTNVMRDVDLQVWRLSRDLDEGPVRLVDVAHLLRLLESHDGLDREVEALPHDDEIDDRREAGAGLTRPELATVLGWAKRRLTDQLLGSDVPEAAAVAPVLAAYVPSTLEGRFPQQLRQHRLRRELIATRIANDVIDRMGATFPSRVADEADVGEADVVRAWWAAREVVRADDVWRRIEGLLADIGPVHQSELALELEALLGSLTRRYLADPDHANLDGLVHRDGDAVLAYGAALARLGSEHQRGHRTARAERLRDDLVPDDVATWVSTTRDLASGPEVAATLRALDWRAERAPVVGEVLLRLVDDLGLGRLSRVLDGVATPTVWRRRLRRSLAGDLRALAAESAEIAIREAGIVGQDVAEGAAAATAFVAHRDAALDRTRRTIAGVESDDQAGLDGVTVALRMLRSATRGA